MPDTTHTTQELVEIEAEEEETVFCTCAHCEADIHTPEDATLVRVQFGRASHETWCEDCRNSATVVTAEGECVAESFAEDNLYYWESDNEYHDGPEPDENELHSYGTNVISIHGWPNRTKRDSLCFGVELEMESKTCRAFSDMVQTLRGRDGNGRYILKSDGSLEDGQGAELVTLPYTLADHQSFFRWDRVLSSSLRDVAMSGKGTENCGIHVHVNRASLSALTIGKMLVFLNSPDNDAFVTTVAQRSSGSFCDRDANKNKVTAVREDSERYDILNIQNYATIEFRMFRGNLRPERVLKNIEFCHALIRFCESVSIQNAADRLLFMGYVEKNVKQYPHLAAFLVEKGRMAAPNERSTAPYAMLVRAGRTAEA